MTIEKNKIKLGQDSVYETGFQDTGHQAKKDGEPNSWPCFLPKGFQAVAYGGDPQGEPE